MLLDELLRELGVPGVELRLSSLGSLERARRVPRGAAGVPARARGGALEGRPRADRRQPAARLRLRRRGDPGGDGRGADDGRAARRARTPSTSPRSGAARPGRDRLHDRRDPGPRPRLLHAHGLLVRLRPARGAVGDRRRRPLRRPGRAARRAADAGRRLGGGNRADPAGARRAEPEPSATSSSPPPTASASARWRWSLELRRAGLSAELDLAGRGDEGTDEARRPDRRAPRVILEDDGSGAAARHGERRAARGRRRRRSSRSWLRDELAAERISRRCGRTATATPGAARCWPTASTREARVAGWVHRRRDHGGLIFIDLRDRTGLVQLVFNPDDAGEAFELGHKLRAEDVLSVAGEVVRRGPETVNPELPTGEVELRVDEAELLADAETPPFQIEGFSGEVGEEMRLRYRYLDLRREPMREAIELRHRVDGGDARVPRRRGLPRHRDAGADPLDPGGRARLPRPQPAPAGLLLRAAAVAAAVQAAADGRRLRALLPDRPLLPRRGPARRPPARLHPARPRDVVRRRRRRASRSTSGCWRTCSARAASRSSCRCRGSPTTRRWPASAPTGRTCASGSSWSTSPTRCATTEFKVFRSVIDGGGVVRGLNAGRRELPRSELDGLISRAQELGAKGLVWAFREGDGWRSPTAKFLSDEELRRPQRAARRRGGRPAAARRRRAAGRRRGARRSCGSTSPSASG